MLIHSEVWGEKLAHRVRPSFGHHKEYFHFLRRGTVKKIGRLRVGLDFAGNTLCFTEDYVPILHRVVLCNSVYQGQPYVHLHRAAFDG